MLTATDEKAFQQFTQNDTKHFFLKRCPKKTKPQ